MLSGGASNSDFLGTPVDKVHRWENGVVQTFRGTSAGAGAILMADGSPTAFAIPNGFFWDAYRREPAFQATSPRSNGPQWIGYPISDIHLPSAAEINAPIWFQGQAGPTNIGGGLVIQTQAGYMTFRAGDADFWVTRTDPTNPGPLIARATTRTSVSLSWSNAVAEDEYQIWQWKNVEWVKIATTKRDVTNFTVNNLSPGTTYQFFVSANNTVGFSFTVIQSFTTLLGPDLDDQIREARSIGSMTMTPNSISDSINVGIDVDMFKFTVKAGQRIIFDVDGSTGGLNSYIRLFKSDGTQLASNDNGSNPMESASAEAYLDYTFNFAGTYFIGISGSGNSSYNPISGDGDGNGSTGSYLLTISPGFAGAALRGTDSSSVDILRFGDNPLAIDPTRTTWVVIHGWNSSRGSSTNNNSIRVLAAEIQRKQSRDQVLTLDWHDAAFSPVSRPDLAERWIESVADWAARTLVAYGFVGTQLNIVGHSFGSYVADELAERVPGGVNTIVALDPALNIFGGYDSESSVNFAAHSAFSWAFHASPLGNPTTPQTADETIRVLNSDHSKVVTLFANMIKTNNRVSDRFLLTRLLNGGAGLWVQNEFNISGDRSHGELVDAVLTAAPGGTTPKSLRYIMLGTNPPLDSTQPTDGPVRPTVV